MYLGIVKLQKLWPTLKCQCFVNQRHNVGGVVTARGLPADGYSPAAPPVVSLQYQHPR